MRLFGKTQGWEEQVDLAATAVSNGLTHYLRTPEVAASAETATFELLAAPDAAAAMLKATGSFDQIVATGLQEADHATRTIQVATWWLAGVAEALNRKDAQAGRKLADAVFPLTPFLVGIIEDESGSVIELDEACALIRMLAYADIPEPWEEEQRMLLGWHDVAVDVVTELAAVHRGTTPAPL